MTFFVADRNTSGSPPSHISICAHVLWPSRIVGFHCAQENLIFSLFWKQAFYDHTSLHDSYTCVRLCSIVVLLANLFC